MQQQQHGGSALRTALNGIPQFSQIRQVCRSNPQALPTVMQQLQQHFPDVFALVQANPQEFLAIINESEAAPGAPFGAPNGPAGQQQQQMQITEADREPIQRLVAIGGGIWDERAAAIVYIVCNRSEEVAANVLFDNGGLPPELAAAMMEGRQEGEDDDGEDGEA
jgi:UV excision repair protein RAD23